MNARLLLSLNLLASLQAAPVSRSSRLTMSASASSRALGLPPRSPEVLTESRAAIVQELNRALGTAATQFKTGDTGTNQSELISNPLESCSITRGSSIIRLAPQPESYATRTCPANAGAPGDSAVFFINISIYSLSPLLCFRNGGERLYLD
jgi:hypothetical protein